METSCIGWEHDTMPLAAILIGSASKIDDQVRNMCLQLNRNGGRRLKMVGLLVARRDYARRLFF